MLFAIYSNIHRFPGLGWISFRTIIQPSNPPKIPLAQTTEDAIGPNHRGCCWPTPVHLAGAHHMDTAAGPLETPGAGCGVSVGSPEPCGPDPNSSYFIFISRPWNPSRTQWHCSLAPFFRSSVLINECSILVGSPDWKTILPVPLGVEPPARCQL